MVKLLFEKIAEKCSSDIAETFDLPKRASIIKEYFQRTQEDAAPQVIGNILRDALYAEGLHWTVGDYSTAIALLCREKLAIGHKVTVVTTNYDQYLEKAFRRTSADSGTAELIHSVAPSLSGSLDADSVLRELAANSDKVPVVHLHGVIPESASSEQSADVVLDEADYLRTEVQTSSILQRLFEVNDVLVLGSSLEDDPLMRALWRTKTGQARRRWAVFPRQNYQHKAGAYSAHEHSYDDLIYALECRCRVFNLDVVAPDFFSQAPQLVREIAVACECMRPSGNMQDYRRANYSKRLAEWWDTWFALRASSNANRKAALISAQRADHRKLATAVGRLQKNTASTTEKLKLELWVRWEPSSRNRGLQLWASSTGTWIDHETMRNADIHAYSEYLAAQTFCEGAACVHEKQGPGHERWKKYLAVPLRVGTELRKLQVGVLILATSAESRDSIIIEKDDKLTTLTDLLSTIGANLLNGH